MSIFYGFDELDATGLEIIEGKIFEKSFDRISDISFEKAMELLQDGFIAAKVKEATDRELFDLPVLVLKNSETVPFGIRTGGSPNFFLAKGGELKFAIVNGYLIPLKTPQAGGFKQRVQ